MTLPYLWRDCMPSRLHCVAYEHAKSIPVGAHFRYDAPYERKTTCEAVHGDIAAWLCSQAVIRKLQVLSGVSGLICDPSFRCGGYHYYWLGGRLGMHTDGNGHPKLNLIKAVQLVVYLSGQDDAGHLHVGDTVVAPKRNLGVVFPPSVRHGIPDAWPHATPRISLVSSYYVSPVVVECHGADFDEDPKRKEKRHDAPASR